MSADAMTAPALPAIAAQRGRRRAVLPRTTRQLARDITNGVVEEHLGPRPARHRKDQSS